MNLLLTSKQRKDIILKNRNGNYPGDESSENDVAKYTMGVTANLTSVDARRLRRYEEAGLLKPARTEGKQRLYSGREVELCKEIAKLEDEGINLEGVKAIIGMRRGERE